MWIELGIGFTYMPSFIGIDVFCNSRECARVARSPNFWLLEVFDELHPDENQSRRGGEDVSCRVEKCPMVP